MVEFVTRLKKETERKIRVIETVDTDVIKRALSISIMLEEVLSELKDFVEGYTFADDAQEIEFFKEKKPEFFRLLLYYRKVYHIETNRPLGSIEMQVAYLKDELNRIQSYIEKRLVFYRYYRSGASYLDRDFFLRANAHLCRGSSTMIVFILNVIRFSRRVLILQLLRSCPTICCKHICCLRLRH